MSSTPIVIRDSKAWGFQAWVSFSIAVLLSGVGLSNLPGAGIDRVFMVMGYVFCLVMAFVLSKYVRDKESGKGDTPMWGAVVWGGFLLSLALTGWGLWRMDVPVVWQAYLGACWAFLMSSVFTLAKMLRDRYEADLIETKNGRSYDRPQAPREE
jgi:hypothetical protein